MHGPLDNLASGRGKQCQASSRTSTSKTFSPSMTSTSLILSWQGPTPVYKVRGTVIGVKGQGAWGKGDWCKGCALMFGIQDLLSCYALVLCVYGLPSGCALMLCTLMLCIHGLPSCCVFRACPHVVHSCCVLVSCCALVLCTHVLPSCCELMLCASRPPPLRSIRWMTGLLASG